MSARFRVSLRMCLEREYQIFMRNNFTFTVERNYYKKIIPRRTCFEDLAGGMWVPVRFFRFYPSREESAAHDDDVARLVSLPFVLRSAIEVTCRSTGAFEYIKAKQVLISFLRPLRLLPPQNPTRSDNKRKTWKKQKLTSFFFGEVAREFRSRSWESFTFFTIASWDIFLQSISWEAEEKKPGENEAKLLWIIIDMALSWHDSSKRSSPREEGEGVLKVCPTTSLSSLRHFRASAFSRSTRKFN